MEVVVGYTALGRILDSVEAALDFDDLALHLFKADIEITPDSAIADFTEADFDGYAAGAVANTGLVYLGPSGDVIWEAAALQFQPTGVVITNIIYGFWIDGTVGGVGSRLVTATKFDAPVPMDSLLSYLSVSPRVVLGQPHGAY